VPDDPTLTVVTTRPEDRVDRLSDGVKLMVASGLLDGPLALILEHSEPAEHIQQHASIEQPFGQSIEGQTVSLRQNRFAVDRPPTHEAVKPGR